MDTLDQDSPSFTQLHPKFGSVVHAVIDSQRIDKLNSASRRPVRGPAMEEVRRSIGVIHADHEANSWLRSLYLDKLAAHPICNKETPSAMIKGQAVIKGRTFFPCLKRLYLLRYALFQREQRNGPTIEDLARTGKYNEYKLTHYYNTFGGARLPQPFVRRYIRKGANIATGSVDNVVRTLKDLDLITLVPCVFDDAAMSIVVSDELMGTIQDWAKLNRDAILRVT